ncbi:C45 family peptidase [Pararhodobacter sp. SW119]|uniref:C45 family autoproteolytic acyltransferase/hydolase n=1 Tax=Pararhodobacter sp. SW119 TaxID=2780075 RepID=UPI001ADFE093|nr:C45 family peptidase [Pararhodobacter sp. SW119]
MTRMTFDAVAEAQPGAKWRGRWQRSWPAYEGWFVARGGDAGPDRRACRAALAQHMPELLPVYNRLLALAGDTDRAAKFLSTWCPPRYLGGCSLAALADGAEVRLVRNYDLSPDLNEGFLLRSEWTGRAVMGMVEFLWGLSDGINDAGLSVALAYGGRTEVGQGFGITTILRYLLETCTTVEDAVKILMRVPSHMAYNVVLADRGGDTASVEVLPGGGARRMPQAIATNHQTGAGRPAGADFSRTYERHAHLQRLASPPQTLHAQFLKAPLRQDRFDAGFGTLFTAEYDPVRGSMRLLWPKEQWHQSLDAFVEGRRTVSLVTPVAVPTQTRPACTAPAPAADVPDWSLSARVDWLAVGRDFAAGRGQPIAAYLAQVAHATGGTRRAACPA